VAARNEARDVKLGLIPLDEMTQVTGLILKT
jgi:hypothetical protein